MADVEGLLRALAEGGVEFILVGGVAATVHGSARLTQDVDVVYSRSSVNLARLASALAAHSPYPRGDPPGLPFRWDEATLRRGLHFTLTTALGDLDLFGELTGGGSYEDLLADTISLRAFAVECRCLGLEGLIRVKRAAGRPRDLEAIAVLEALREERDRGGR
jgi:predicted nucleotidyltransferase